MFEERQKPQARWDLRTLSADQSLRWRATRAALTAEPGAKGCSRHRDNPGHRGSVRFRRPFRCGTSGSPWSAGLLARYRSRRRELAGQAWPRLIGQRGNRFLPRPNERSWMERSCCTKDQGRRAVGVRAGRPAKTETDGRGTPREGNADSALRQAEQQRRCRCSTERDVRRRCWADPRRHPVGPRAGSDEQQVPRAEEQPDVLDLQRQPPLQLEHRQQQKGVWARAVMPTRLRTGTSRRRSTRVIGAEGSA